LYEGIALSILASVEQGYDFILLVRLQPTYVIFPFGQYELNNAKLSYSCRLL
jgi:hypothetical protein